MKVIVAYLILTYHYYNEILTKKTYVDKSTTQKCNMHLFTFQGGRDEYMNMSRNKNSKVKFSASLRRKENGKSYLRRKIRPCQV